MNILLSKLTRLSVIQMTLKDFTLKTEVDTSLEMCFVTKWADQAVLCLVKHVHMK